MGLLSKATLVAVLNVPTPFSSHTRSLGICSTPPPPPPQAAWPMYLRMSPARCGFRKISSLPSFTHSVAITLGKRGEGEQGGGDSSLFTLLWSHPTYLRISPVRCGCWNTHSLASKGGGDVLPQERGKSTGGGRGTNNPAAPHITYLRMSPAKCGFWNTSSLSSFTMNSGRLVRP